MMGQKVSLDKREQQFVLKLADRFQSKGDDSDWVTRKQLETDDGSQPDFQGMLGKFVRFGFLKVVSSSHFRILPQVLEAADQIKNPAVKNEFAELTKWWFSKRWRAWITVVCVGIPMAVQWVDGLVKIIRWLTGSLH